MEFTWEINQLDCIPSLDGMDKAISVIHYRAQKHFQDLYIDSENQEKDYIAFTAQINDSLSVPAPHEASFTPYDEVTKEMVEGWLTEKLDVVSIEANLDAQIGNFLNPPLVAYALPWNNN